MKKILLMLLAFLFLIFTNCEKQYSPEETQNLIQEYLLTIVADMQDWQLGKMTENQFKDNTRNNLNKIEDIIDKSTVSEAQKRIYKNAFEMYYKLLDDDFY